MLDKQFEPQPVIAEADRSIPETRNLPTKSPRSSGFKLPRLNSIGGKLFVGVMGGALVGLGGMAYFFYGALKSQVESELQNILSNKVSLINGKLAQAETLTDTFRASISALHTQGIQERETYIKLNFETFKQRPDFVKGIGFGQGPFGVLKNQQWFYPYFFVDPGDPESPGKPLPAPYNNIRYADENQPGDFYPETDYYKDFFIPQKRIWTEPYAYFNLTVVSFYNPIYDDKKRWLGSLSVEVDGTSFDNEIKGAAVRGAGYFALLTEGGLIVSYPLNPQKALKVETYKSIPGLSAVWSQLKQGKSGLVHKDNNYWVYEHIPRSNWIAVASVPQSVVLEPVLSMTLGGTLAVAVLLALVVALFVQNLNRRLQPILFQCNKLTQPDAATQAITQRQDEIGQLSTSFYNLLAQVAANEEQIQKEAAARLLEAQERLRLATEAQQEGEALQTEVGHILDVVSTLEAGDLTVQATVSDRATGLVADTLNRLIEELGRTMAQVLKAAQQVSEGSTALGQQAETVANNAQQQAQEVVQVLSLTEQVEQSATSSALTLNLTNQSLLQVRSAVEQGQVAVDNMTKGIDVLQQGTDQIIQRMKALGEFVGLADQFVQDQSQIASLTQVLALNATLVAARASEQRDPRQFLVVAREFEAIAAQVSTLAQQTNDGLVSLQQRTDQIHTVVSAIDAEVQSLGGLVSGFTTGVEQSNQVFGNVRAATVEVVQAGEAVSQFSQEIVTAAQSTAKAMHDIADLAARTADLTSQTRQQSEGMETLSSRLLDSIRFFRLPMSVNSEQLSVNSTRDN